jgi:hypothetical protein
MNWEALGAVAESVGAIAVFVSLVYVAVQIRQNTKQFSRSVEANQLAAFERNVESGNRIRELLILHPDLAQLLLCGFKDYKELEGSEKFRFGMLLRNVFSGLQGGYIRQLAMEHDPEEFEGTARMLDEILLNQGARDWLDDNEPDWRPAFRDLVDARLSAIREREAAKQQEAKALI